jgi:penicillin-binding protein 2
MSDNSRVRVSIVGVVIVALFSALLARLWFLQMGPERNLKAQTAALYTRQIQTESPRGQILDRHGVVLAQDRAAWAVTIDRKLTHKTQTLDRVIGQLSETLCQASPPPCNDSAKNLKSRFNSVRQSPLLPAVVALDVGIDQRLAILQHRDQYPGVDITQLTVRDYPAATKFHDPEFAAQVLGTVGEIDDAQLKTLKKRGYQAGDSIGRDGIEAAYESSLHGRPEISSIQVDPTGAQIGPATVLQPGAAGNNVYLTLDANVQVAAEKALANGILHARTISDGDKNNPKNYAAPAGAVVVVDTHDGSIVASASNPSFDPNEFVGGISQEKLDALHAPDSHQPLLNRVTSGQYAPGSTFKLVTATALTKAGIRGAFTQYEDTGSVRIGGDQQLFTNDNGERNGWVDLSSALTRSSDTYFYTAGDAFWQSYNAGDKAKGAGLQQESRDFGFGQKTGVEIDEAPGRVPDPQWKADFAKALYPKDPTARQQNSIWYPGDEVHLAVGQGDVLVTPLQLADAYAMFANGGTEWQPHFGFQVKDAKGKVVKTVAPKQLRTMQFDPTVYGQMMAGFVGAVNNPKGTAYNAFQGFAGETVAGKTGTAQVIGKQATSVFVGMYPAQQPRYVVAALVEEAGHGADVAAPIVRQVLEAILHLPQSQITTTTGKD